MPSLTQRSDLPGGAVARRHLTAGHAIALLAAVALWLLAAWQLWSSTPLPAIATSHLNADRYLTHAFLSRSSSYQTFLDVDEALATIVLLLTLWAYALRGERFMRESAAGPIGTGMLLGMLGFAIVWIAQLPFGLAALWWQRSHHISHVGYVPWAVSSFFSLGFTFLFVCLGLLIAMGFARILRRWWWMAAAPAFAGLALLSAFVSPYLLSNVHPLHDRALLADARTLARVEGVPGTKVEVQKVATQTTAPNAEAVGFGPTKRVVLWDTLLNGKFTNKEIKVVIAHELGHISHEDTLRTVGWLALLMLPLAGAIAFATRTRGGMSQPQAVPLALFVLVSLTIVLTPVQNVISRRIEASADWAALNATHDPAADRALMRQLSMKSLSDPNPPTWSYLLYATHPSEMQRIALANAWEARNRASTGTSANGR